MLWRYFKCDDLFLVLFTILLHQYYFLYINFCSDSFDIFGTFFTSVKFFASYTPVFYLFDTRFRFSAIKMIESVKSVNYVMSFFIPHFFFERSIQKLSVSCF